MFNLLYLNSNYASHMTGVVCILIFMSISYSMHTADYRLGVARPFLMLKALFLTLP
jgi:hypothetical protein